MPPVLGPVSPSPTRLWSCAGAIGTIGATVDEREQRALRAGEELLDEHRRARVAEAAVEALVDRSLRGAEVHRDGHALAGRQAVGLDDDGRAELVDRGVGGLALARR